MLSWSIFYFFLCPQKHFEFAAFQGQKITFKYVQNKKEDIKEQNTNSLSSALI